MRSIAESCPRFVPRACRWLATGTIAVGLLASTSCAETTKLMLPVAPELAAQLQRLERGRQRIEALQETIQRQLNQVEKQLTLQRHL